MAIKLMTKAGVSTNRNDIVWECSDSLAAVTNGYTILIPGGVKKVTCTLSVSGGGKGKVQASTDTIDTLQNGSPVWIDWDAGEVAANTQDFCEPVSALRLVQTFAGTTLLTVRAQ